MVWASLPAWAGSGSRALLFGQKHKFDVQPETIVVASDVGHALQARAVPVLQPTKRAAGYSKPHLGGDVEGRAPRRRRCLETRAHAR